uniref:serine/arginine repetitive matrix protein 2-like isoform X2 n=1 Tax=Oncorhynchus gorbuscha TaxID=8017 RepID=UPI001EAE8DFB|nr:serine/arginine repetitive matrix protein 2-like isoform X2 [Oncorhynchus gorbuscha]
MALNQDEIIEGMEIKMEVEEVATNTEVQVDVAGSEESDKALSNSNLATPKRGRGRPPKYGSVSKSDKSLSNGNPSTPKRGRGRPPTYGSVSKSDKSLSNGNPSTPKRGRGRPPTYGSVSKSDKSLSNGNPSTPNRGRGRPPTYGSVSKSDKSLSNGNPSTPKRGRPKGSVLMKTKMLKVIGLAAACLPRKPDDPSPKKHGPPSKVESTRKSLTPKGEEDRKLESQARRPPGSPSIYPRIDSPVTEPRGRGRPRKTKVATKSPIYDGPPRKRGRPPGAANKVKRGAEQDKDNSEPPVKRSFHAKEKSEEAGFPLVEESDQEGETGRVDQESEDPKNPVTPSDPITPNRGRPKGSVSKLLGSPITPNRGRPKGSVSKLLGSPITPNRGRPKGSVSKLLGSPITPNRGRPKGSVSKLLGSPITPNRGRPKGSVSKLLGSPVTPNRGRPKGSVSKLLGSPITPNRGRPKGSVSKLLGSPITPNRGRPKGSVSKLLGSPITPNRGRPKGSVSKLLGSPITPKRGRPKGSVFTQPKILKATGEPTRGQPREVVDLSLDKHGRPSIVQLKRGRGRPKKILTPDEEEELKKLESQPRRPRGRPRIYPCDDPPVTEPRGRGRPRKRGRPPGAANKVKRGAEQNNNNSEPPVKRSFHAKEKSEEAGFPPVEESDQEDETGRVDQESEDPKNPVTTSDPITPNRGRPKGSVSKLLGSPITPNRGRPKGSVSKLLGSPITPNRGRPKGSVSKLLGSPITPNRGRPKGSVSKLLGSPITPNRGRPKGSVSKLLGSPITPNRGRPKGSVSKLLGSPITPNRGRPKGSVSKLLGSPITPNRGRPKGSVSKLLGSPITPNRGRPKGSVFTQPKILKVIGLAAACLPQKPDDPSPKKRGRPSKVESTRKSLTPKGEEDRKLESQARRPPGSPRIYPCIDSPVTEPRGRGRPRKSGHPPGAANKVKRGEEQDKDNSETPVKCNFHSKDKTEEAGFSPVEESDQEDETGRVDEESETGKNIEKSPQSQLPPVTVIALSVP